MRVSTVSCCIFSICQGNKICFTFFLYFFLLFFSFFFFSIFTRVIRSIGYYPFLGTYDTFSEMDRSRKKTTTNLFIQFNLISFHFVYFYFILFSVIQKTDFNNTIRSSFFCFLSFVFFFFNILIVISSNNGALKK